MTEQRVTEFIEHMRSRNMSPKTLKAYLYDCTEFVSFLAAVELKRKEIYRFQTYLHERRLAMSSVRRKMAAVKSFLDWLHIETDIPDVMNGMKRPKAPDILPDVPSLELVFQIIENTLVPRNRCILEMLYGTGVRNDELCGINMDDLEGTDTILIRGKGSKERRVIYGEYAREALDAWLRVREHYIKKKGFSTPALFFSTGPHSSAERLDVRTVHRIVQQAARKYMHGCHPHLLRHSFATHSLDKGMPLEVIGKLLGHERLSTTAHYARVSTTKMLENYRKAHPHA